MFFSKVSKQSKLKKSLLCVGLDPNLDKLKQTNFKGNLFDYNKIIIEATHDFGIVYKLQFAFYAAFGLENELMETIIYLKKYHPKIGIILDSKRSDIGSTSEAYAKESFERYSVDAVTINPYLGYDSIKPFLKYKNKGLLILARTSNPSANKIQELIVNHKPLYLKVLDSCFSNLTNEEMQQIGLVVGASCYDATKQIYAKYPNNWLLMPGVGAQGGKIDDIANDQDKLMISLSRALYLYDRDEQKIFNYAKQQSQKYVYQMQSKFNLKYINQ